jgi:glycosyltransferase family protein
MKKRMYSLDKNRWIKKNYSDLKMFEDKNLHSMLDTLKQVKQGKSLARYGDGEITLMDGDGIDFQAANSNLAEELHEILTKKNDAIVVCLPTILKACNQIEENWWLKFWYVRWADLKFKLNREMKYGHSMVTRPDFFIMYPEHAVQAWQEIWHGRQVLFITGKGSKLNIDHELFRNINSSDVIFSLSENAFDDLDRVIFEVKNNFDNKYLILIALGPSGTVLANRLSKRGYQALDIGHITSSYDEAVEQESI